MTPDEIMQLADKYVIAYARFIFKSTEEAKLIAEKARADLQAAVTTTSQFGGL
jgi:hypothetical protein